MRVLRKLFNGPLLVDLNARRSIESNKRLSPTRSGTGNNTLIHDYIRLPASKRFSQRSFMPQRAFMLNPFRKKHCTLR